MEHIKIKFPAIDATIQNWNDEKINYVVWYDQFLYKYSKSYFIKNCLNHLLIDSSGNVFRVVDRKDIPFWKKIIPFMPKYELIFDYEKTMSYEEVKGLIENKIQNIIGKEIIQTNIHNSSNTADLIGRL